jgi:hypothetical protein
MLGTLHASGRKLVLMEGTQLASLEFTSLKKLNNSALQAQMAMTPGRCTKRCSKTQKISIKR